MRLQALIDYLEKIFPLTLAEDWDNVGLLLGDRGQNVERVATCLTIDEAVADEAVADKIDCIVSHHPFPFHASKKWTTDTTDGRILRKLLGAGIAVYSPHTAHDSALFGVNRQLAAGLGLVEVKPLYPGDVVATRDMLDGLDADEEKLVESEFVASGKGRASTPATLGTGRIGKLPKPLKFFELVEQVKDMLQVDRTLVVGARDKTIRKVALGCGAADEFIGRAAELGADAMLLGEARFHSCLEARAQRLALILPGHYATERFAMCILAERIAQKFPVYVKASVKETDPLRIE